MTFRRREIDDQLWEIDDRTSRMNDRLLEVYGAVRRIEDWTRHVEAILAKEMLRALTEKRCGECGQITGERGMGA